MKIIWTLFLILGLTLGAKCQNLEAKSKSMVRYCLRNYDRFYFTNLSDSRIQQIKKALNVDTLRSEEKHYQEPVRTLILTQPERLYIASELNKPRLPDSYSNLLETGTVKATEKANIFYYTRKSEPVGIKTDAYANWCSFSIPIFLRNNSLCIFYFDSGVQGNLAIYKKASDGWLPWLIVYTWIS